MASSSPASPLKATPDTGSECPGIVLTGRPARTSHTITTSSKPPEACAGCGRGRAGAGDGCGSGR